MIKLMIVDDEALICDGLKLMLSLFKDIEVVATATNGKEAFEKCQTHEVKVVLMDTSMPDYDGVMGTRRIKEGLALRNPFTFSCATVIPNCCPSSYNARYFSK